MNGGLQPEKAARPDPDRRSLQPGFQSWCVHDGLVRRAPQPEQRALLPAPGPGSSRPPQPEKEEEKRGKKKRGECGPAITIAGSQGPSLLLVLRIRLCLYNACLLRHLHAMLLQVPRMGAVDVLGKLGCRDQLLSHRSPRVVDEITVRLPRQ